MAKASRSGRNAKQAPRSPARIAALVGTAALLILLGLKLITFLGTPSGQRLLGSTDTGRRLVDAAAIGLVEELRHLSIRPADIDRRAAPRIKTGEPGAERWTITVPRKVSLIECNLVVTRAVRHLGLEIQDAWEHRYGDGNRPALSISLAATGRGKHLSGAVRAGADPDLTGSMLPEPGGPEHGRLLGEHERYRLTFVQFPAKDRGLLAIVIDDFGFSWSEAAAGFLALELPLTMAILPGYKSSRRVADAARARGHEVILHLPMEPKGYPREKPGPEAILIGQKPTEVKAHIGRALKSVGPVSGISNHMGSLATADTELMRLVLAETDRRGLYFLDSCTTPRSVVRPVSRRLGVACAGNRLFIDADRSRAMIARRLDEAIELAVRDGEVIVIGHPFPETLEVLTAALPRIDARGVRLVRLSEVIPRPLVD